jgi:hypothetical protein
MSRLYILVRIRSLLEKWLKLFIAAKYRGEVGSSIIPRDICPTY